MLKNIIIFLVLNIVCSKAINIHVQNGVTDDCGLTSCYDCTNNGCLWCNSDSSINPNSCWALSDIFDNCDIGDIDVISYECPTCPPNCNCEDGTCTSCTAGFYGENCDLECDNICDQCDRITGECTSCIQLGKCGNACNSSCVTVPGCELCQINCLNCTQCIRGYYNPSMSCLGNCPSCFNFDCNQQNGDCQSYCMPGWVGHDCNEICEGICEKPKVCSATGCVCPKGYQPGNVETCVKVDLGISCEQCEKLIGVAKMASSMITQTFETYEEAKEALEEISCFFLPPPIDLGCALLVAAQAGVYAIAGQVAEVLLEKDFCIEWGSCNISHVSV
ncbi:hypothetical protein DLAC_02979 [Tieghemostelium lacteum]|uniref:EGF-like domain-containing protein n=1 Tax=Tieghemostelium lacteum TaxID=361077 RepID=A0A152A3X4_TIELA|nr:hypothetical protein DLAC_02979 [Tieghemostelium lacteum]|eukprot:KYR00914.1 hypothetical protein DLAC_02979 [Tieghemostelium lacteum]